MEIARDVDETGARQVHEAVSDAAWPHLGPDSTKRKSHGSLVSKNRFTPSVKEQDDGAANEETTSALEKGDDIDCQLFIQLDPHVPARRVLRRWQKVGWISAVNHLTADRREEKTFRVKDARKVKRKSRIDETCTEKKQTSSLTGIQLVFQTVELPNINAMQTEGLWEMIDLAVDSGAAVTVVAECQDQGKPSEQQRHRVRSRER